MQLMSFIPWSLEAVYILTLLLEKQIIIILDLHFAPPDGDTKQI